MAAARWWPVALSGEIESGKVTGFSINDEAVAIFRDGEGIVRALEDRCPHRRVPLSLGEVTPAGQLQCGYHGWTFDGESGKCVDIPSMRPGDHIPPVYGAFAYRASERDGLVHVAAVPPRGDEPPLAQSHHAVPDKVFSGREMIGLGHAEYVRALLDGPDLLLKVTGMRISGTMISDPELVDGWLTTERAAYWRGQSSFDGFVKEYKLIFRLEVRPVTGEAWISFVKPDGTLVSRAHWVPTRAARGVTSLLWRSFASKSGGARARILRATRVLGKAPIAPRKSIDMARVAALLAGPSEQWYTDESETTLYGQVLRTERAKR